MVQGMHLSEQGREQITVLGYEKQLLNSGSTTLCVRSDLLCSVIHLKVTNACVTSVYC
ncbi:hypothetical protein SAMN05428978_10128 [Nitrosomonas sp. Nm34]|nr:hypothetical protein SAMN05428978_10128 [Nitrosomonas sp. Nm34]